MKNNPKGSKVQADAAVSLTNEQKIELKDVLESWKTDKGLVVASLLQNGSDIKITFKLVPTELGNKIIGIVDEFYKGETDVNS